MQSEHPPKKALEIAKSEVQEWPGKSVYKDGWETHFTPECWSMECPYSSWSIKLSIQLPSITLANVLGRPVESTWKKTQFWVRCCKLVQVICYELNLSFSDFLFTTLHMNCSRKSDINECKPKMLNKSCVIETGPYIYLSELVVHKLEDSCDDLLLCIDNKAARASTRVG